MPNVSRDELVLEHLPFAQRMAQCLQRTLPRHVNYDELEADAYFGLLKAAAGFDPTRNVKFRTYAAKRIHGEMIDGLRERQQLRRQHTPLRIQSLDTCVCGEDGRMMRLADQIPSREPPVGSELEIHEEVSFILHRLDAGTRRQVTDREVRGLTQSEIAANLGITISAVSQRMKRIRVLARQIDPSRN